MSLGSFFLIITVVFPVVNMVYVYFPRKYSVIFPSLILWVPSSFFVKSAKSVRMFPNRMEILSLGILTERSEYATITAQ